MKGKKIKTCKTLDGHPATIHYVWRPLRMFSKEYWLTVYSKTNKNEIIHSSKKLNEKQAVNDAEFWTLTDYIDRLMKSHNVSF